MKIAIYARVSTQDQHTDNQLDVLRKWAKDLGATEVLEYVDHASGGKSDRVQFQKMLSDAHTSRFTHLLIWALDRLSREGIIKLAGYLELLKGRGVRVRSFQESWLDTSGPVSDLLIAIFAWVAQQERIRLGERVKAGLERAKKNGKTLGRPAYDVDLRLMNELHKQGESIRGISKIMSVSKSLVARALKSS